MEVDTHSGVNSGRVLTPGATSGAENRKETSFRLQIPKTKHVVDVCIRCVSPGVWCCPFRLWLYILCFCDVVVVFFFSQCGMSGEWLACYIWHNTDRVP